MLAILNPYAGGGKAMERWRRVERELGQRLGHFHTWIPRSSEELRRSLPGFLSQGYHQLLVGGGDGTMNAVLSGIVSHGMPVFADGITVGAVGLGSSNDFHKPFATIVHGIPCRIDFRHPQLQDAGLLDYEDERGVRKARHWFVNASIGIASEANRLFNEPDRVLRLLKPSSASTAITYAALRSVLTNRARLLDLQIDDQAPRRVATRNIGFVKNPHFAGGLHYDSPHLPDSGSFHVHHIGPVSVWQLLRTLLRLGRGEFAGEKGTRSWLAREASVAGLDGSFPVECDGEVVVARRARFSILSQKVRVCP